MKATAQKQATIRPLLSIKADDAGNLPSKLEVLQTGMWEAPYHGDFMITPQDLQQYIQNFNADVRPSSSSKGLPIDLDHDAGAAAGWMTGLNALPNDQGGWSLWADVSWTPMGSQKLLDGEYAFFSPEFCPEGYLDPEGDDEPCDNVLIGGGLTNRPLFKELQPIMASDASGKSSGLKSQFNKMFLNAKENVVPNLDEVRVKEVANLTTEERQLLTDSKDQLSADELAKFDFVDGNNNPNPEDGNDPAPADPAAAPAADQPAAPAAPVAASDKGKQVTISASELENLKSAAAQGVSANERLLHKEAEDHITSKVFSASEGFKFPQDIKEDLVNLYVGASEDQKKVLDKVFDAAKPMKAADQMASQGSGDEHTAGSAYQALSDKAAEIMKASDGKTEFTDALLEARKQNPELAASYDQEYQTGKPQLASR